MVCKFGAANTVLLECSLPVHPAAFIPCHESESRVLARARPVLLPYAKYWRRLRGSDRMRLALADSVSSAGRPMEAEQRRSEDWRGGRVKLIPANSGAAGLTSICFYRMRITLVPLYLAAILVQKIRGRAAVGGNLRDPFSLLWGSVLQLPFLLRSRSDAFSHSKRHLYISASRNIQANG